jgi:hypothetical protein
MVKFARRSTCFLLAEFTMEREIWSEDSPRLMLVRLESGAHAYINYLAQRGEKDVMRVGFEPTPQE